MTNWKVEVAFALGRQNVSPNAWPLIVRAANALQRLHEAECSIVPEAWTESLRKRAQAACKRLREWSKASGSKLTLEVQTDPRGCPLIVNGVRIGGEGFRAEWFERAERVAYAERDAVR